MPCASENMIQCFPKLCEEQVRAQRHITGDWILPVKRSSHGGQQCLKPQKTLPVPKISCAGRASVTQDRVTVPLALPTAAGVQGGKDF